MKALTLTQPWATLIAIGAKRIETRSWATAYRGPLAIHAAKRFPREAREFAEALSFRDYPDLEELPVGAIVAVAALIGIRFTVDVVDQISDREREFGDYGLGRHAWMLADMFPLPEPIACKGALGLWDVPAGILEQLQSR